MIHAKGTAGTRDDKSVDFKVKFEQLPMREWLPTSWHEHVAGAAAGEVRWRGKDPKMHSASVQGALRVDGRPGRGHGVFEKAGGADEKEIA